jgi:DNA-binding response OmpR family regulator
MTKPINWDEMLLRIGALLKRANMVNERKITCGATIIDLDSQTVNQGDESLTLPLKEFNLLFKLISYPNKTFTRQQLMDEIWGMDSESDVRTVDVHINRLRERFKGCDDFEIITVRGLGYKVVKS